MTLWSTGATHSFRKQRTGFFQDPLHRGRVGLIADSLQEWNAESSDGVATIIQDRKRNVDHALHLVARSFLISTPLDLSQTRVKIAWRARFVLLTPKLDRPGGGFGSL